MELIDAIANMFKEHPYIPGVLLMVLCVCIGWLLGRWRRFVLKRQVAGGDLRDLLTIEKILIRDHADGRTTMRIRSCGAEPIHNVLLNPVAQEEFHRRTRATSPAQPLLNLEDRTGSFLLHLLQPWVCGLTEGGAFPLDVWVMAPVCEPSILSAYQTTTVILIRQTDLVRFRHWDTCKKMQVEHGSDGARLLTLWHMSNAFEKQLTEVKRLRQEGQRSTYVETMYILDLGLSVEEVNLPTKPVPWQRFEKTLKELGLNA